MFQSIRNVAQQAHKAAISANFYIKNPNTLRLRRRDPIPLQDLSGHFMSYRPKQQTKTEA